ncbi:YqiJ family protein [Acinetobacter rudis]|uniref:Inner membrane protein yqiJ n=1 Tax=Acinetobacter rudis CIP 110305 TaxID=421052 RepID=S3NIW9_9GAMM|nr:YqiJ family protein [Acinetobacter rudis]EPF80005.1 hypothetical protein F945_00897 [Acinetobacter rudis CIP 110305]
MLWQLFIEPANLVFSISLCLMLFLGITEAILLLVGSSSQGLLEQFLPDQITGQHVELQTVENNSAFVSLLEWLYLGKVPLLIWFVIFLTVYALFGFIGQSLIYTVSGHYLSIWIAAPASLLLCMPLVRFSALIIAKILPQDQSTAIYSDELIGRTGIIILGEAKPNSPAQAKVKDQFGLTHYVLVEPETDTIYVQGQHVVLTQRTTLGFKATSEFI